MHRNCAKGYFRAADNKATTCASECSPTRITNAPRVLKVVFPINDHTNCRLFVAKLPMLGKTVESCEELTPNHWASVAAY